MYYSELADIKFGEFVAFGTPDYLPARIAELVRIVQTSNLELQGLVVTRRPLLLAPERYAFVASRVEDISDNIDEMKARLADCLAEDAPYFERLSPRSRVRECRSMRPVDFMPEEVCYSISYEKCSVPSDDFHEDLEMEAPLVDDEEAIDDALNFDRKKWLDKLSALVLEYVTANHAMPPQELIDTVISGKLQITDDNALSPIVVNGNMEIILPAYNELELRMTPLARAVYILFLCHPEGIVLKNIDSYRDRLLDIYLMVKPGADSNLAKMYIDELTYPGGDSLQQKLSLIKRSINRYLLRGNIASAYYITGQRGKAYKIAGITADRITLPRALRYT
jgi:hypothetical protein